MADGCDALVLVTEWSEYRDLDWEALAQRMRDPFLLDGRHALDREKLITRARACATIERISLTSARLVLCRSSRSRRPINGLFPINVSLFEYRSSFGRPCIAGLA